jgi:hypothetical protein
MNKLYHSFCVYDYKGGELCSNINQTIEDIALSIEVDWEELFDYCSDDEKFDNMSDEEFSSLTCVQLLSMLSDETLKSIATDQIYPGNTYAFDSHSDYEIFTANENGKLKRVNIIEEPGFVEAFRKSLHESAEYWDNRKE